ncbi:MAG: thioredoxin [Candidatus Magasanikbacteria bacterium]|nr:thioredoxin [Candidatus Magasanikbacteria bacterium]
MYMLILTDQNFSAEVLQAKVPVFVDFWAPWCGPCRLTGPFVEALATEFEGQPVKIGKLNVDENAATASQYGVMSIPTFMIFKGGQPADQIVGGVSREQLKALIAKHL